MSKPALIAASLLAADFTRLGDEIRQAEKAGVDWIHIDVMDGSFVPNITMGPLVVKAAKSVTSLPLDVHLMIVSPERHLETFIEAGASTLTVHIETCPHIHRTLQTIRQLGCKAGVVINPGTPASSIQPVIHMVDLVLVMTVNPGFGGQHFIRETLPKIAEIRQMLDAIQSSAWLEVDGGIAADTIAQVFQAGAQTFVAGTALFNHPDGIAAGVQALRTHLVSLK